MTPLIIALALAVVQPTANDRAQRIGDVLGMLPMFANPAGVIIISVGVLVLTDSRPWLTSDRERWWSHASQQE